MGIFVEEAAAFIIGGLMAGAYLFVHYISGAATDSTYRALLLIFLVICIILATVGVADVFLDHIGSNENEQQTTP